MAMTVRLPKELDEKLEQLARARHTSKHALLVEAADRFMNEASKTSLVLAAADEVMAQYAHTIERLKDT